MDNIKIIYNPNAGKKSKEMLFNVLTELEVHKVRYDLEATQYAGHGIKIAKRLSKDDNVNLIIAAGGDGTINEVLNGIIGSSKKLGIIPLGTANVLAKEIGLKIHPKHIADTLIKQKSVKIFPAMINKKYFSLMASIGYDAHAVQNVNLKLKK
ncbi:MAG: diacylglycerol kinase family protein, partial [Emcibacteraceae bacterium]|nr:diacylglycerol kinase family protein [Emcibacteraceae bacterium]